MALVPGYMYSGSRCRAVGSGERSARGFSLNRRARIPADRPARACGVRLAGIARFAERTGDARAIQLLSRTIGTGRPVLVRRVILEISSAAHVAASEVSSPKVVPSGVVPLGFSACPIIPGPATGCPLVVERLGAR